MEIGDVLDNRYLLVSKLQTAWLATDQREGQHCLVRQAADFIDPAVAAWLGEVRHPGLPRLLNVLADAGMTCYVFEYLEGTSLSQLAAASGGKLPASELLPAISQAARILSFLHQQNGKTVLHLDIKPDHVLLDERGQVSLIDFGAARVMRTGQDEDSSVSDRIALTPDYAAPELLYGHPEPGSDIYALGLTLLQLLTGLPPASCRSMALPELMPDFPTALQRLMGRCLQTNLTIRYTQADELASDLEALHFAPTQLAIRPEIEERSLSAPLLCVWDGAEFGCELAAVMAKTQRVLVIDADLLNPRADLLLGLRKRDSIPDIKRLSAGLDQVLAQEQRGHLDITLLNQLIQPTRINGVDLLNSSHGLDHYEFYDLDSMYQVIRLARLICDRVIILCSKFIYDAFTCLCLQEATRVLVPLAADGGAFRERRRSIEYLAERQQLDIAKLNFAAFCYDEQADLSRGTLDELSGGRLIGCISECNQRRRMKSGAKLYAGNLAPNNQREYLALINKLRLHEHARKAVV